MVMNVRIGAAAAAVAGVLALSISGCAPASPGATEEPATSGAPSAEQPSGTLVWYSSQNPIMEEATIEAFEAEYPDVRIELLHLTTGELSVRYAQERTSDSGAADVVTLSDPAFMRQGVVDGWWEPEITTADGWPAEATVDGVSRLGLLVSVLSYNSDIVASSDIPDSWESLLDPAWKDKLLLVDPRNVPSYLALMQVWREEYGDDFLVKLGEQNPQLAASVVPGNQSLGAGAAAVLAPSTQIAANAVKNEGGPVEVVGLSPTTGSELYGAVASNAQNPVAAQAFVEFLTSKAGQESFNGEDGVAIRTDTSGTAQRPESYIPLDDVLPAAMENRDEILKLLGIE